MRRVLGWLWEQDSETWLQWGLMLICLVVLWLCALSIVARA